MSRRNSKSSVGVLLIFSLFIVGAVYVYNSAMFERDVPKITLQSNGYWNLKKPLKINIDDANGIKLYRVILETSKEKIVLSHEQPLELSNEVEIKIASPRGAYVMKDKNVKIIVEATDSSKWNFLSGNSTVKKFDLIIDRKRPQLSSVAHSYKITKGGSALVILKVFDDNLNDLYIETNYKKKFKLQPFYKEGYYISLVAWPVTEKNFKATMVATDRAGNKAKSYIPFYLKQKNYRVSNIKLSDRFLKGKIAELAEDFAETQGINDSIEQFVMINENVREKNEILIHKITSKISDEMISDFKIKKMYPLRNAQVVASFGDHRKYSYQGNSISESYHLGLDLASNAQASIKPQNGGDIVYADFNGLYGNMPIVDHGLGLFTLYGHCSSLSVNDGDFINANSEIANTGASGYAMGDHLHFGVLVQGIEVRPAEWMDKKWIKLNISDIIKSAKKIIDRDN